MQLFNPDFTQAETKPGNDFFAEVEADGEIKTLIMSTCYDCHSNQVNYPWYAKVSPVSYWINDHIKDGQKHLNFSEWATYSAKKKSHKMEECWEEIKEEEMPLYSYTIMHADAQFSEEQAAALIAFFQAQEERFKP